MNGQHCFSIVLYPMPLLSILRDNDHEKMSWLKFGAVALPLPYQLSN